MPLLDSQKVELFEFIKRNGFNPGDFEYVTYNVSQKIHQRSSKITRNRINYKVDDRYGFTVYLYLKAYIIDCTPYINEWNYSGSVNSWNDVLNVFTHWLASITKESEAGSVWESIIKGDWNKKVSDLNARFTPEEKKYLKEKLTDLIGIVSSDNRINAESKETFIKELEYSRTFVDIAPRKEDWKALLLFHLFVAFVDSPIYEVIKNYANQLLIDYGKHFDQLINLLPK